MCQFLDDAEIANVLSSAWRKARKGHRCAECGRPIAAGETYFAERLMVDGSFDFVKTCAHCRVARDWLEAECRGWLYRGVAEDIHSHAQDQRFPPGVRLLAHGMRQRWCRPDGRLYPVPRLPPTTHQLMAQSASTT